MYDAQYVPYCNGLFEQLGRETADLRARVQELEQRAAPAPAPAPAPIAPVSTTEDVWPQSSANDYDSFGSNVRVAAAANCLRDVSCLREYDQSGVSSIAQFADSCLAQGGEPTLYRSDGTVATQDVVTSYVGDRAAGGRPEARCVRGGAVVSVVGDHTCTTWNPYYDSCVARYP